MRQYRLKRLHGFFLRHLYPLRRDLDLLSDMVYWPLIDLALWGITSQWLYESSSGTNIVATILIALVLWNILWRSQAEVSRNLIDEIWNNNLVNLFSTPFTAKEWVVGVLSLSILKTALTLAVIIPVVLLLYSVNLSALGLWIIPFFASTAMTGWWIGFISAGIVLRFGPRVQTVVWTLPGALLPFSAVYFPLEKLPFFIQPISRLIPTTYTFEAMRSVVNMGTVNSSDLLIGFALNLVYLALTIRFFFKSFEKSLELGLGRFD